MAYSYKGSISFGLVYIPVTLHMCVKTKDISFNFIDKSTMSRIRYKKTCLDCDGKEVKNEDIVKGYEYEEGKYVIIEDEDFERVKTKRDKSITIERFVKLAEIDPTFFEKAYYVMPTGAENAYSLLLAAMEKTQMAGIAKAVLGTKDTLIVLRAKNGQMLLNTLYFDDEITANPAKHLTPSKSAKELELAVSLISNMSGEFRPQDYRDEYRAKVAALLESKISGKRVSLPKEQAPSNIINLMDALKASIQGTSPGGKNKKASKSAPPAAADKKKKTSAPSVLAKPRSKGEGDTLGH